MTDNTTPTMAARIRALLGGGPLTRHELAVILNMTRQRLAHHLDRQLSRGLLSEGDAGVSLIRCSLREDMAERERRLRARQARCSARRKAKRALKPKRPLLTAHNDVKRDIRKRRVVLLAASRARLA